jgi:two-component system response regulator MprA
MVLVVNDDEDMSETIRDLLHGHYDVEVAHDGRAALEKLRAGLRPCIILLDLVMPIMTGLEFRKEQLSDAELAPIPVVVFSAMVDLETRLGDLAATACIQLPRDVERIPELLQQHCLK